jgi:GT2 family glycosyltransferase
MSIAADKIAIVIPTVGRVDDLRKMLESLERQTRQPEQVVIIDEAGEGHALAREFSRLNIAVTTFPGGSASAKRNRGMELVAPDIELIGFMDDDIVLEPAAVKAMMDFWKTAGADVAGAGCNWVNQDPLYARRLKSLPVVSWLGLYDARGGRVMPSGFQTLIGVVSENRYVQWLSSIAVVYRRHLLAEHHFDEWYEGYSYLEDLDLSYALSRKYKLAVVAGARFRHYPSSLGRPDTYLFGKKEVINRLHFVRKHPELSVGRCLLALGVRNLMSLYRAVTRLDKASFRRALGNLAAAFRSGAA